MAADPLFVGITRPAMLAGVTYAGVIINAMVCLVPFILFNNFLFLALLVPVHGLMWIVCRWDARFFDLILVWTQTTATARHRDYWQGAAYRQ